MEKSEPSLVPEWLRNTGGGPGAGNSSHHMASSDGPLLALSKNSRTSKSISNSHSSHSSFLDRSSSTNSQRTLSNNGFSKQEKNSYTRSYSSSTRNQRSRDRERLDTNDPWDSDYPDFVTNIISGRIQKDTLKRSQSLISRKPSDLSPRNVFPNLRNNSHNINGHENGATSVASGTAGIQKVSFDWDFPQLGSEERPITPDMARVSSLRLSKGVQGSSIGTSPLIGSEGWTSALAEVPVGVGSDSVSSPLALEPPLYTTAVAAAVSLGSDAATAPPAYASTTGAAGASSGLHKISALAQAPVRSQNAPQQSLQVQRFEELPFVGSKRLIPMTPSLPKTSVLNPSDKLKPKAALRPYEAVSGPKNGLQQTSSLQLGTLPVHGGGARADGSKSCASGKLQLLKHARDNGPFPSQTVNVPSGLASGQSTSALFNSSLPLKNTNNVKPVDKKCSPTPAQSRNDFFNLVRKQSMNNTSAAADSGTVSAGLQNPAELKEMASGSLTPTENDSEGQCNGDVCNLPESSSFSWESDLSDDAVIYPNQEEEAFLRSLGWEDSAGDEGGLTEEEINAFVQKVKIMTQSDHMKWRPASKLCRGLQSKILTQSNSQASCSTGASCELRTADSSF